MNISLTPEQEVFVQLQIQGGEYKSVDQVIEAALLLLQQRHQSLDGIRQKIEFGVAGKQISDHPQQKLDSGRSMLSLEEMRKMIGTDKPA